MGSLFLDEDFLRQFNSRYTARSGMSHMTTDSQNKEFLTFVSPTPRLSPRGRNKFSFTNISVIMEKEACSCSCPATMIIHLGTVLLKDLRKT